MLISCEKCSTTYVLDDALIPPQGAPVQCTRCGHVFTAKLTSSEPTPPPPARSPTPVGSSTMMFGAPAAAQQAPQKNQTMMFGTPASNTAAPAAAAKPPPAANPKATMVFGTAASNAAAQNPPSAPAANPRNTMMFGQGAQAPVPKSSPSPAPAKNQTMMFGTAASNAAAAAKDNPPPSSNQSKQTMVFGSAVAPPAPAPAKNQTMMFGTAASNAAAAASTTAPQAPTSGKQTMVFGSAVPAPAPAPSKNQTMMMFNPAAEPPPESGSEPEETILDAPGQSSRTVLFGTVQPQTPPEAPAAPPAAKNQTMMFGRAAIPKVTAGTVELAGYAADENAPAESTVRVDVQEVIEEQGDEPPAEAPRHDRTQRFAMTDVGPNTPSEGKNAVQDRHNRTQLFAMSTSNEATAPLGAPLEPDSVLVGDTTLPPGGMAVLDRRGPSPNTTDLNTTLPPDDGGDPPGVSLLHDPSKASSVAPIELREGPVATTLPNLPPLAMERPMQPLPLELPPEPGGAPEDLRAVQLSEQQAAAQDAAAMRAARGGGAGKAIVIVLVLIALALAGVLVYRLFGKQLLGDAAPAEALKSTESALASLRFDDAQSQANAVNALQAVLVKHPNLPQTHAALVVAAAVRFDDAQGRALRTAEALRSLKSNDAPAAKLTATEEKLTAAKTEAEGLKVELQKAMAQLSPLLASAEPGSPAHLSMLRADGLARGVLGDVEALTTAEHFRQRATAADDWVDLIEPEFALNGGSSLDEAIIQLVQVKSRDTNSTFLRPYVLLARLQLMKGEVSKAKEELERVSTMNSKHEVARELLASIEAP